MFALLVDKSDPVSGFYSEVDDWAHGETDMVGCADHDMNYLELGELLAGICHAKIPKSGEPPGWLVYVLAVYVRQGIKLLGVGPNILDRSHFGAIQSPAEGSGTNQLLKMLFGQSRVV